MQGKCQTPEDCQILRNELEVSQMIMCQLQTSGQSISASQLHIKESIEEEVGIRFRLEAGIH